jgi:Toprim-like
MADTGESPEKRWACALTLTGTKGQAYVERRGIPVSIAIDADVRYDPAWVGRSAVIAPMKDADGALRAIHGRYIEPSRRQDKMLTIGPAGGVINVMGGCRRSTIILVEGLFDALSLAACGYGSVATVGRWAPWLAEACASKIVWLAFDSNRPGDIQVGRYKQILTKSEIHRLLPPGHSKDWNTALVKGGAGAVEAWLHRRLPDVKPF